MSHPSTQADRRPSTSSQSSRGGPETNPAVSHRAAASISSNNADSHGLLNDAVIIANRSGMERQEDVQQVSPSSTVRTTPARSLGVQSMLNPSSDTTPTSVGEVTTQPTLPPLNLSPRSRKRTEPASPTRDVSTAFPYLQSRHIITPKSPGARAASITATLPPISTTTMISPPNLTKSDSHVYYAEPGSAGVPALPPLPSVQRSYSHAHSLEPSHLIPLGPSPRAPSMQVVPPISTVVRDHEIDRPRFTPSHADQLSPSLQYKVAAHASPTLLRQDGYSSGIKAADAYQAGHTSYQMTLETEQGPMVVPVELDLMQASKVADEKRKRNAGASARFRARRKEKEKEASSTISSLQAELREVRAQRDFYREERDFMRDFAARHMGMNQIPPRPASPILHTRAMSDISPSEATVENDEDTRPRSDSAPASQRRRTGDYQPAFTPSRQEHPAPAPYGAVYHGQPGNSLPLPPNMPAPYPGDRTLPPGPPSGPPLGPRSHASYDPFRRDIH